jgi:ribosomal protein S18 acetylase RimI-like enzyme
MKYNIRPLKPTEYNILDIFLYEAIFIPDGVQPPPRDIIKLPELQVYVEDFGSRRGDICLAAEVNGKIVGAVWTRIMNDYGHIDDDTPSLAMSLIKEYRGLGIGTALLSQMLDELTANGFKSVSLSVQKMNYAYRLYKKLGFTVVRKTEEEYIMLRKL